MTCLEVTTVGSIAIQAVVVVAGPTASGDANPIAPVALRSCTQMSTRPSPSFSGAG